MENMNKHGRCCDHETPGVAGAPSWSWSPGQRDIIKTVALVLMVLDHANRILHLDQTWMFWPGGARFRCLPWCGGSICPVMRISGSRRCPGCGDGL